MPSFGNTSMRRLNTCCEEIQQILMLSIKVVDFSVIEGARTQELQDHYYSVGASTLKWPNSKHNVTDDRPKSEAVDIWPYTKRWGALSGSDKQINRIAIEIKKEIEGLEEAQLRAREYVYKAFAHLAGVNQGVASTLNIKLRWGGDWDGDGDMLDQRFHDLPHLEIVRA